MKLFLLLTPSLMLMSVDAHYFFDRLLVNKTWSEPWEYIRNISPSDTTNPSPTDYDYITPITDPSSLHLRCGRTTSPFSATKTALIHAGSTVGFALNTTVGLPIPNAPIMPWDRYPNFYHPGPATAWLSKAPDGALNTYEGDGSWFKILSVVNRTSQSVPPNDEYWWKHQWGTYQATNWTFEIPAATPAGEYLLRFEQIYPLPVDSLQGSQFYVNCAHVKIINDNSDVGVPGPTVEIPGVYTFGQKEIYFYADVGNETYDIRDFVEPKPPVWRG